MRPAVQTKSKPSFSVVDLITTDKDKRFEQPARMADAIIRIIQEQGDCLPQDLSPEEFPAPYVARYWHMAHTMAKIELKCAPSRSAFLTVRGASHA
ncbi:MAG: hypothetical protein PHS57_01080 [Alphaproteobacteria bacterium]|nr:hypothetical protein [Alphaproteobacteria bacterium]